MTGEDDSALNRAGTALLHAAKLQARLRQEGGLNDEGYRKLLVSTRRHLEMANPSEEPHRFLAVKNALEALEAIERGDSTLGGIEIFKAFVESVHGGERVMDFGGRRRQGNKPSVDQAYLRAAAVALWERFPAERARLVSQARTLIGVRTESQLRKMVENFHTRHDFDTTRSSSPLSIHMGVVNDLIEHHGYRTLKDFV